VLKTREDVAAELARIRDSVRQRALVPREGKDLLPVPHPLRPAEPVPSEAFPAPTPATPRPDAAGVNESWRAEAPTPAGIKGFMVRALERWLGPRFAAQVEWNARQVRLDNEVLDYIDARLDSTHRHYDAVLGVTGRHLGEIDERHMIVQEELVAHVHDLVTRIDLVLAESERGRIGLEHSLRELRSRLAALEERLGRG
jgi:hypothetical protein